MRLLVALLPVLALGSTAASAQSPTATIRGIVVDQTDARLPGAQIVVTREETMEARRAAADPEGRFTVPELPVGTYIIEATLAGFSTFRQRAHLAVGSDVWVQARLAVSTSASIVAVGEAPVPLVERGPA